MNAVGPVILGIVMAAVPPLPSSAIAKLPVEARCDLISRIMSFRIEVHPGLFRQAIAEDDAVHRLAYWRGKPVVCARVLERKATDQIPVFSASESCGETFALLEGAGKNATDRPEACVGVELSPDPRGHVQFTATIRVLKSPRILPPGYGVGVGHAPVKGTARRKGNAWELKQLFKPKPEVL